MRLVDNAALSAAMDRGRPVIPVFILDEVEAGRGACSRWRLGLGAEALGAALSAVGSRLVFRRGPALEVLRDVAAEAGAGAVFWTRAYDPDAIARDKAVKAGLKADGRIAESVPGHLLFEPWEVETKTGEPYRVYSPFWRSVQGRSVPAPLSAPGKIECPDVWPASDDPAHWDLAAAMHRGASVVRQHLAIGESAAADRLAVFLRDRIANYRARRDFPADPATSRLSENLTYGEISPRVAWHAGQRALAEGLAGAETFLKELVWREFAYHLIYHTPHITTRNWREGWDRFPWNEDETRSDVVAWTQGRTGLRFVDAAMREMYVTGHMHNRARMIVASYLTKHLLTHWRIGLNWFGDCLADWDPASNAMGWQWTAGSGPDAAPYFRVFNPVSQLEKFDADGAYAHRWIAEGDPRPSQTALSYFDAVPRSWDLSAGMVYPDPVVTAEEGRNRALTAYEMREF